MGCWAAGRASFTFFTFLPFPLFTFLRTFAAVMLVKTGAIVLRALRYGESKMVVDTFTRECGRLSFMVSVPQKARSRVKKQYFQPLAQLDMECEVRPSRELQRIREVGMACAYASLPFDSCKLSIAMFVAEFLCHALRGEQHGGPLFDYVADSLLWLDGSKDGFANFHIVFLIRLSRFLGFYPNLDGYAPGCSFDLRASCFCDRPPLHPDYLGPREAALVGIMVRMNFATMRLYRLSRDERNRLVDIIIRYYRIHLPGFPELRSLAVLRELHG